jgi:hypothetical protein
MKFWSLGSSTGTATKYPRLGKPAKRLQGIANRFRLRRPRLQMPFKLL